MKRILTAAVLIPLVLYAIFGGFPWLLTALVSVFAALCFYEYSTIAKGFGMPVSPAAGILAGLPLIVITREHLAILVIISLGAFAWAMRGESLQQVLPRSAAMTFGLVYIFGSWKCGLMLAQVSPWWLLFAVGINWVGDISAYYAGRTFGQHKLAPRISPGKTWEGAIASSVVCVICGVAYFQRFLPQVSLAETVAISALVNAVGQLGDLAESALKRGAGIKDSGTILPGHGGFLDRVDSTLFTMPFVYLYLQISSR
jgi:phosphatidate cytidylyltransferase